MQGVGSCVMRDLGCGMWDAWGGLKTLKARGVLRVGMAKSFAAVRNRLEQCRESKDAAGVVEMRSLFDYRNVS